LLIRYSSKSLTQHLHLIVAISFITEQNLGRNHHFAVLSAPDKGKHTGLDEKLVNIIANGILETGALMLHI
jgi:hypothetical protein